MKSRGIRSGLSMLEVLVGVAIFSFGMLPILNLTHRATSTAFSLTKHMIARQAAGGLMDALLDQPFDECRAILKTQGTEPANVFDNDLIRRHIESTLLAESDVEFTDDAQRLGNTFMYWVEVAEPPADSPDFNHMFSITIVVTWLDDPGKTSSERFITLQAVKFRHP